MKQLIAIALTAAILTSCSTLQQAQPYFEVAAAIGTTEFLNSAKDAKTRAEYVAIINEVGQAVQTLSSGALLTPEQFNAEVAKRVPTSVTAAHYIAVVSGVYAVAYLNFKDRPELKNDQINRLATIILNAAH